LDHDNYEWLNAAMSHLSSTHEAPVDTSSSRPEFVPLPPAGAVEPNSGLKRGKLCQLILPCASNDWKPPVKSVSLRPRNCQKGKRLIHLPSLLDYLHGQMQRAGWQAPSALAGAKRKKHTSAVTGEFSKTHKASNRKADKE